MTGAGVRGEVDGNGFDPRGAVGDGSDGYKGAGVRQVGHDADLELVLGLGLPEEEAHL